MLMTLPPAPPVLTVAACDDELTRLSGERATALATGALVKVMRLDVRIDGMLDLRLELAAEGDSHEHEVAA